MLIKKIIVIVLFLVSSQSFAYSSYTQVYHDMPFPEYLRNVTVPEVKAQSMSLIAEGCNSQGKVNQYTVACGYFGYVIQNSHNYEDARYTVDKIICVDHGVCTLIRTNYIVKPLEVINVSRHRVDYTVKSSVAKTYEVEAYLNVSGSETKNVVGLGKMQIFP